MEDKNKQILLSILGVAILIVAVVGISFAAFAYSKTGQNINEITTGTITMEYTDSEPTINISNALPTTDATGKILSGTNQYFDFTVKATINGSGTTTINYKVTGKQETGSSDLPNTAVKVYLTKGAVTSGSEVAYATTSTPKLVSQLTVVGSNDISGAASGEYILDSGTFTATTTNKYRLRMWIDNDYTGDASGDITSKSYKLRVNVYGKAAAQ